MKSPTVRDLKANELSTAVFLVQSKEVRQKRTGEPYLSLLLADRTGEIDAKMWDNVAEVMDTFDRDDFIKVKALMQLYNNRPQLTIHKLRRMSDPEVDFADFFPASDRDPEEMWTELRGIVSALANPLIRDILNAFLDDPDIATRFKIAPAAKTIHHAYRSGLLEHVLSVANLAKLTAPHYAVRYHVDLDLVIAGAVLHDIGKIYELTYDRGFGYSAEGQLIGHISIAVRMLTEKLRAFPNFPVELRNLIEHMILSHHGLLEYGSPKVPIFPEALLLHYLDDLDSKMECMRVLTEQDPQAEGFFTRYSNSMERVALRKTRYLESQAGSPSSTAAAGPSVSSPPVSPPSVSPVATDDLWGDNGATSHITPAPAPMSKPKPYQPASTSIFGDKLKQALHDERK